MMKARIPFGVVLLALALLLTAGMGPVRGAEPSDPSGPASVTLSPGATAPWFVETVDAAAGTGSHVSVAIDPVSGTTYISYYDASNQDLKMATHVGSGGNCGPDNSWSCETVDADSDVGQYSSIAIDPTTNLPVIAYWRMMSPYALKLATATGGGWDILTIDTLPGSHASLKVDSTGAAHIAYYGFVMADNLMYAVRVGSGTGNCGVANFRCSSIDSGGGIGHYPSLALDGSDQPRIAYYDSDNGGLWYAQPSASGNCGPGSTWDCYAISTSSDVGRHASLDVDSANIPHIASYDATSGKLVYAVQVGSEGNCGYLGSWQCDEIATMGTLPRTRDVSLAVDPAGLPIIAYSWYYGAQFTTRGFGWARPAAALGLQSGDCGPEQLWQCERIDGAFRGDYSAIAVHPSGLATAAYDISEYPGGLKVAYQRLYQVLLPIVIRHE
jgi:hypothetical protein